MQGGAAAGDEATTAVDWLVQCCKAVRSRTQCWLCAQVAINWCMAQDTVPIPGAKTLRQAADNVAAMDWRLSDGEAAALTEAASRVPKPMLQNIFQTS